jgi:hypothetical protein
MRDKKDRTSTSNDQASRQPKKKLVLNRETLRRLELSAEQLRTVAGGVVCGSDDGTGVQC